MSASTFKSCCLLNFGENVVNFDLKRVSRDIFITCRLFVFEPSTQKFQQSDTKVQNARICAFGDQDPDADCQIVDYQTLQWAETQQAFPFLLLRLRHPGSKSPVQFAVFGLTVAEGTLSFAALDNPIPFTEDGGSVRGWGPKLAHGPTVLWAANGEFHVERCQATTGVNSWKINISSYRHVFDLHLVVTIPFRDFQHDSKFFPIDEKYATVLQSSEPPSKKLCLEDHADSTDARGLKPDQSAILTIAISSKLLGHRSELKLNVAVASKRKDGDKMTSSCIGLSPITVAMQDIFSEEPLNLNTKCKDKDALHDLAALNAYTNTNVKLVILSKETELTGILNLLQNRASMTYHPFLDILFWKTAQHLCLNNVWLTLIKSHRFEAHITVHARNRSQFFEVMHYLYGKLPADILILPDDGVPPKTLSSSLLDEANLVSSYLGNVGGAGRDQSQSSGGPCQTNSLDLNGYRDFRRKLFKLEQETDAIAASVNNLKHAQSS